MKLSMTNFEALKGSEDELVEWADLKPLPPLQPSAESMHEIMIPEVFRDWACSAAKELSITPEAIAVPAIIAVGSLIGRKLAIRPNPYNSDWIEHSLFWGGIVSLPGSKKSSCIEIATGPLKAIQNRIKEEWKEKSPQVKADRFIKETVLESLKKKIQEAVAGEEKPLGSLQEQFATAEEELQSIRTASPCLVLNESTVQALQMILSENQNGVLWLCDELTGLLTKLDRDEQQEQRSFLLTGYNGYSSFTGYTVGRGETTIPAVAVSILGGIQPEVYQKLFESQIKGGNAGDGLFSRLLMSVWPELPEYQRNTTPQNLAVKERVQQIYDWIYAQDFSTYGLLEVAGAPTLPFSPEAQAVFFNFQDALYKRTRSSSQDESPAFLSWLAKTEGLFPRLALAFHVIDMANGTPLGPVSLTAALRARDWVEFLEVHARKLLSGAIRPSLKSAHALARKIKSGQVTDGMKIREIYRHEWPHLATSSEVVEALIVLETYEWSRCIRNKGGKVTEFSLNPLLVSSGLLK